MIKTAEQVLIYNNFIKWDVLADLTAQAYTKSSADTLNVYIDMYKIMMDLYEPKLEVKNSNIITSTMINLCAHIRSYYWNRHRVNTNIFLVYSDMSTDYNRTFYPGYNSSNISKVHSNRRITDIINTNMDLLNTLCPYLPDIYFVRGIYEPSVIILDLIYKEEASGNTYPNLVLSRDDTALQLPAILSNTTIFLDSKRSGISMYANSGNALPVYLAKTGRNRLLSDPDIYKKIEAIPNSLLSILIALTNLPSRSVKSAYDINKAMNLIYPVTSNPNLYMADTGKIYDSLFMGREGKLLRDSFILRYRAIDLISSHRSYSYTPYANDVSYKVNLDDGDAVRAINNEYFRTNPLDLNRL